MADMSQFSKKSEYPSQTENRRQWILDVVRENQGDVANLLVRAQQEQWIAAKSILNGTEKMDRDALLQPGGILTEDQIRKLT